ncbi:hypothetical protein NPIL_654581 [Nephila pilipes]|uniref:Gem-associated protein 2 n=1 Tax=Nephila pilipes TaxID=299642 RepID=A0A8X6MVZ2_NEPPI|nr:hypothetical protein NPIL_654581 [Nephila pilipes]
MTKNARSTFLRIQGLKQSCSMKLYFTEETMFDNGDEDWPFNKRKASLFVEPATRHIDVDTNPHDGSEFIRKSRLEQDLAADTSYWAPKKKLKLFGRSQAHEFSRYAMELKNNRETLLQKFPRKREYFYRKNGDMDWCLFMFGSEVCYEIYGYCLQGFEGHDPVFSCILYYTQEEIKMLINLIYKFFNWIGMLPEMSSWLHALLTCLERPVDCDFQMVLEEFLSRLRWYLREQDSDNAHAYYIALVLQQNFCAN